jgi:hypothetical protein
VPSANASTLVFSNGSTTYPITALITFTIGSTDFDSSGLPSMDGLSVTSTTRRSLLGAMSSQSDMSPYLFVEEGGHDDIFAGEEARLTYATSPHFSAPHFSQDAAKFAAYAGVDLSPSVAAAHQLQALGGELTSMANGTAALLGSVRSLKQSTPAARPSPPSPPASSSTCSAAQLNPTKPDSGLILSVSTGGAEATNQLDNQPSLALWCIRPEAHCDVQQDRGGAVSCIP